MICFNALLNSRKFHFYLRERGLTVPLARVKEFVSRQESAQMTHAFRRPLKFASILAKDPGDNYQIDIMIYNRREFKGFQYVFGVIDVHSRYVHCIPMKSRSDSAILKCFEETFQVLGVPNKINMDLLNNVDA